MLPRLVLIVAVLFCINATPNNDWWKNSVIYQIYPRSFRDDNNDGIGDLRGVISKLDHLKDAGVTAAWLSPIFKSPQVDQGYDISDYTAIDEAYGTMADFDEMVAKAHELGIKIIMDFVPNHSSNQHEWFIKSEDNDLEYKDFYIWRDGPPEEPPNNWISNFKNSAWTYSLKRQQWYLHQFAPEQPDLNYRNEEVKTKMKEVIQFWLDKGVDGFRMDAVPYLVEDELFENEPLSGNPNAGPEDYEYLIHTLTSDQQGTYDTIYEWREFIDDFNSKHPEEDPRIMMTEAYTSLENTMKYYTDGTRDGAHFTFNFFFITDLDKSSTAQDFITIIEKWMTAMPEGHVANWVLGNHDNHRVASRFGPERVDGLNTLVTFLPGVMVTYNGEEIGQENGEVSLSQCKDPRACKLETEEEYQAYTRDLERTPFHWDDSINAGFNEGTIPWLPVSSKFATNNLAAQSVSGLKSHYHIYKDLVKLRQEPGFSEASLKYSALSDNVLTFTKSIEGGKVYVVAINMGDKEETVDLSTLTDVGDYISIHIADSTSNKRKYSILNSKSIALAPYESFVGLSVGGDPNWWKTAVVYQIYPLSFKDSDNSGEGDLQGIISKLDHLKDAGITAAWLSPIFKTGNKDQGYDIISFKDVDERFGTMADLEMLIAKAHEIGIKIILDFVPNHTSNEHEWFAKSERSEPGYENYYIWRGGLVFPPNNWKSIFGGSAWQFSSTRRQRYLHQFLKEQPDLNYREPAVVNEMNDVLTFWLDKGVDGFRMDAVPYLVEDDQFLDEEKTETATGDEWADYKHAYTSDQPGTFNMIYQWRELVHNYYAANGGDARVLMTEAYTDIENTMKYYGSDVQDGAHFTFNFQMITRLNKESNAKDIVDAINEWLEKMPSHYTANWVLGNHDNHRVATRFGVDNVDGFNMLMGILPGVMVTYNGEEIGQENGEVPFSQCVDTSACGSGVTEEEFTAKSRDFERTPFHWDDTINAGFNEGNPTWLPVSSKYLETNLKAQTNTNDLSHYQIYKQLIALRKESTLINGELEIKALSDNVLAYTRTLEGSDTYVFVFNVGTNAETVNLVNEFPGMSPSLKIILPSGQSQHKNGDLLSTQGLFLQAHESIIAITSSEVIETTTPVVTESTTPEVTKSTTPEVTETTTPGVIETTTAGSTNVPVTITALFLGAICSLSF